MTETVELSGKMELIVSFAEYDNTEEVPLPTMASREMTYMDLLTDRVVNLLLGGGRAPAEK
jgi:hypothetical protein